jgi:hypothetical protein
MTQRRTCTPYATLLFGLLLLLARPALAQDQTLPDAAAQSASDSPVVSGPVIHETDESAWTYPKTYAVRPLTMQKGMVRANGIFTVWDDGVDTIFGMNLGGSVSVTDDLELGINNYRVGSSLQQRYEGLIPVIFTPSSAAGFGNMPLYGRYRFLRRDKIDFAADLVLVLPVDTDFALEADLPLRIRARERLSVDTGLEVRGTFGSAERADIRIPAIVNYSFSDHAFISAETGLWFVNLGKNFDTPTNDSEGFAIPIGFRAGGSWQKRDKHLIDLFGGFAFPALIEAGTSRSTVDFGIWDLFVGVVFHTRPLF